MIKRKINSTVNQQITEISVFLRELQLLNLNDQLLLKYNTSGHLHKNTTYILAPSWGKDFATTLATKWRLLKEKKEIFQVLAVILMIIFVIIYKYETSIFWS